MVNTIAIKQNTKLIFYLLLLLSLSCNKENKKTNQVTAPISENSNTNIPVYNFDELEPLLYTDANKTYIVNFWAMWCAPCVKELPYFQAYANTHQDVEVILVSMDFPKDIELKLKPFLKQNKITNKVVILDDPDANTWINKIDPNWSGAIPFTIIFNNNKRAFYERSFKNEKDLETEINNTINN